MRRETTTVYIAFDDKVFTDETNCAQYENDLLEEYAINLGQKALNVISGDNVHLLNGCFWGSDADDYVAVDLSNDSVWEIVSSWIRYSHSDDDIKRDKERMTNAVKRGAYVVFDIYDKRLDYVGTFDEIILALQKDILNNFFGD